MPRASRLAALVPAVSLLAFLAPTGSAAADPGRGARPAATCGAGDVEVITGLLNVRSGPSARHAVIAQVRSGEVLLCHRLVNGGAYRACGVSGDDRWAEVTAHGLRGFAVSACLADRVVGGASGGHDDRT